MYLEDLGKLILGGRGPPGIFCRIINNFLLFYHGQLIRTILESLSKRRAASRLLVAALQLALSFAPPSPHPPTESYPEWFLKKRQRPLFIAYLGKRGGGVETKLNVQFYFECPHFLFLSTATGKPRNI